MQSRIELLTKALDAFQIRDSSVKTTVPVLPEGDASNSFGNTLTKFLNEASDTDAAKSDLQQRFTNGENVDLHQVMAATEEASIALDLVVELRNKTVDAYRTIISMQS
ncbi:MAG: flagellar hook-basal body complex protein FliE [Gemmatimonadaceae bacterium]